MTMEPIATDRKSPAPAAGLPAADGALLDQFTAQGDQEAFSALVKRHGPYVLSLCRRLTFHAQDAEDVFQACFLELARNAASIRQRHSVAGWLQTVAVRLSKKSRERRARRRQKEAAQARCEAVTRNDDISWREVRQVLEEEIAGLPEELRLPLVLCLFQEQTPEQAAQYLELNPCTLRGRLRRGRALLRQRLTRRGVTLAVLAVLLSVGQSQAAVSTALSHAAVQGAAAVSSKASLTSIVPPAVLSLTASSSVLTSWGALAAAFVGLVLCGSAVYVTWDRPATSQPQENPQTAPAGRRTLQRSFRGKQFDTGLFAWSGPTPHKYVNLEEEGLRITLPAQDGPNKPVGIKLRYPVRGDFDMQATVEFLTVGHPAGPARGATAYFYMDSAERDGVWIGKVHDGWQGIAYIAGQRFTAAGKQRDLKWYKVWPRGEEQGLTRLRVIRQGAVFSLFAAEGAAGHYELLDSVEVSALDVQIVRLAADPGWRPLRAAVDIRLVELSITAQEFVGY